MILLAKSPVADVTQGPLRIELPTGLIGLKHLRHFEVEALEGNWPFVSMRAVGSEQWDFLLLEPAGAVPEYDIELTDEDTDALELERAEDAYIFNIVTVHSAEPQYATVNLIGPIVVNRHTLVGRQVILANSELYSTTHVLVDDRATAECAV